MIDAADWSKLKELFDRALMLDGAERERFVAEACAHDCGLKSQLLRLLAAHDGAGDFLSVPALACAQEEVPERRLFNPDQVVSGRFLIRRLIARGGMGDVYEALDQVLGEKVALKAIWADAARGLDLARIRTEVQSARRVTHANVCRTYDIALHDEPPAALVTMELLEGPTLSAHLRRHGLFSRKEALPIIRQICAGLQAAHDAGVIHRDLKPGNVILTGSPGRWHPVITDFGLALSAGESGDGTCVHGGTPGFMAPEQAQGRPVTPATDVYALGMVIMRMTGALPTSFRPALPEGSAPDAPLPARGPAGPWKRIVDRCLEEDPAKRFQRPAEVAAALERIRLRRRHAAAVIGIPGLLTVAVAALLFLRPNFISHPQPQPASGPDLLVRTANRGGASTGAPVPESTPVPAGPLKRQIPLPKPDVTVWRPAPDGKSLILTDYDPSASNLALWDLRSGLLRAVTPADAHAAVSGIYPEYPVFSPDGRRVVYRKGAGELRIANVDGMEDKHFYEDPANQLALPQDWSPDGERILVGAVREGLRTTLILSARDGTPLHAIAHRDPIVNRALFFRDGTRVICEVNQDEGQDAANIELVDPASGQRSLLVQSNADDRIVAWTADRRQLLFVSDRGGTHGVWMLPFSKEGVAGEPQELKPDMDGMWPVGLTGSGRLYYTITRSDRNVFTAGIDVERARTITAPQRVSVKFRGEQRYPSWSPDGRRLAFYLLGSRDARGTVAVWTRETGEVQLLKSKEVYLSSPQWFGTGGWLIGPGWDAAWKSGYYKINSADGEVRLAYEASAITQGSFAGLWSRDGTWHINRYYGGGQKGLFRLNVLTGERLTLYVPPPRCNLGREALALSPDETLLAFQAFRPEPEQSSLVVVPANGGEARTLWSFGKPYAFWNGAFTWSRDGRYVIAARDRGGISEIWRVPLDGGAHVKIDFPATKRIMVLRMNPDGKTIAFVAGDQPKPELWLLENFLPR